MECKSRRLYCPDCKLEEQKRGSGKCPSFNRMLAKKRAAVAAKAKSEMEKIQDTHMMQCREGMKEDDVFLRGMVGNSL